MISTRYKFVFIHVPKTGGNSIQEALEPFSDDHKVTGDFRDGIDRFGIEGPITPFKHATLADYASRVDLREYRIAMGCREPFSRAIAAYFSPNRWYREDAGGSWNAIDPEWDLQAFAAFLPRLRPMVDFIAPLCRPTLLLRFEDLAKDFSAFTTTLGLAPITLERRNQSAASAPLRDLAKACEMARAMVRDRYAIDYAEFGY